MASVSLALSHLDTLAKSLAPKRDWEDGDGSGSGAGGLAMLYATMDSVGFLTFVVEHCREVDALRTELPTALQRCVDPARFPMDAERGLPMDRRAVRSPTDLAWACEDVLLYLGAQRPLGRRGWLALDMHHGSNGRALYDNA